MGTLQKLLRQTDVILGVGILAVVTMLILPIPHWLLDISLVFTFGASIMILLSAVNVEDPLQFSVFPSLLLITTLFRLSLSIAATKLILGTGAAGRVIETFGNFVMGGNFVVGFVAFLILVIVQFIVITNGAGRVSEVVARFTLDAMPGKQMAIDADLAAGLIDEITARARRKQIKQEADFYGAMDGASKFVKGDAIAALLIIAVNIIGGFVVGYMRGEGDFMTILKTYSLLSVGEGLVSQIPALLISTSSGLLVTRTGQERSMGSAVIGQLFNQPKAIFSTGVALACFSLIPGFPSLIFLTIGGALIMLSQFITKNHEALSLVEPLTATATTLSAPSLQEPEAKSPSPTVMSPEAVLPLLVVDPLEIEIGYGLTRLADARAGGDLPERVSSTRRQIALELGFVMPSVRIRDSLSLSANEYTIKVRGEEVARTEIQPNMILAINSGAVIQPISGIHTQEPVFGLDALWIEPHMREQAERSGYTVIEPTAMITTHLSEIIKTHAAELLSRQDVQTLIENVKQQNQTVVEELIPNIMHVGDVQKVLQHLLRERVPIRDMVTILETLADFGTRIKDHEQLGEIVRAAIARTITRQYLDNNGKLYCVTLEPMLEKSLSEQVQQTTAGSFLAMEPQEQQLFINHVRRVSEQAMAKGYQPIILCSSHLRLSLRRLIERYLPTLPVLAYNEVTAKAQVEFIDQLQSPSIVAAA
jgi:flagellar biosynthesis protein FlhA